MHQEVRQQPGYPQQGYPNYQQPAYPPYPQQGQAPYPGYPPQQGYPQYPQNQYNPNVQIPVYDGGGAPSPRRQGGFGNWGQADWEVSDDKRLEEGMDISIRHAFIRKVYGILSCQLLTTFGLALWFNLQTSAALWLYQNPWVLIIATIAMCFTICGFTCVPKAARTVPTNYIMLGVLSVCMGLILGYSTGAVTTPAFAVAAGMTAAVTLTVSLFACQTKWDFTGFGVFAVCGLVILLIFGLVASFVRNKIVHLVYASLGAALFTFYIIMDTQKIVGGKHRKYTFSIDDYAFAALALYLDIINLFMFILQIVAMTDQ